MSGMDRLTDEKRAAYTHVGSVIKDAQAFDGGYLWHGWSIREAFLAGAAWEAHRRASQAAPAPSDGLREAEFWRDNYSKRTEEKNAMRYEVERLTAALKWVWDNGDCRGEAVKVIRAALSASPAQEEEPRHD